DGAPRRRRVHIECVRLDVDEDRPRAQAPDRAGGGKEAIRRRDDLVARPDPERHQGNQQGVGSRRDAHRMRGAAVRGELFFDRRLLRPKNESLAFEHARNRRVHFAADARVLCFEVESRNAHAMIIPAMMRRWHFSRTRPQWWTRGRRWARAPASGIFLMSRRPRALAPIAFSVRTSTWAPCASETG